jgi:hypothetical protein
LLSRPSTAFRLVPLARLSSALYSGLGRRFRGTRLSAQCLRIDFFSFTAFHLHDSYALPSISNSSSSAFYITLTVGAVPSSRYRVLAHEQTVGLLFSYITYPLSSPSHSPFMSYVLNVHVPSDLPCTIQSEIVFYIVTL